MGGRGGHRGNGPGGAASAGDRGGLGRRHLHAGAFRRHRRDLPGLRRGWLAGPALCPAPCLVRAVSAPVRAEPLRFAARPRCRDIGPGTPLALGRRRQRFREVLAEPVSAERLPGGLVAGACLVGNLSRCHGTADDRRVGAAGLPRIRLALPADHGTAGISPASSSWRRALAAVDVAQRACRAITASERTSWPSTPPRPAAAPSAACRAARAWPAVPGTGGGSLACCYAGPGNIRGTGRPGPCGLSAGTAPRSPGTAWLQHVIPATASVYAGGGGGRESNPPAPQRSAHRF